MFVAVIIEPYWSAIYLALEPGDLVLIHPNDCTVNPYVWVQADDPAAWYALKKSEFQIIGEL